MEERIGNERQEVRQLVNNAGLRYTTAKIILKYSCFLLTLQLIVFWLFNYAPITLPNHIHYTPIKLDGFILGAIFITVFIFAIKNLLKVNPTFTILKLVLYGTVIGFTTEVIFQIVRMSTFSDYGIKERLHYFISGVTIISSFDIFLSFFIAYQIKTKKTANLIGLIFLCITAFNIILRLFWSGILPPLNP